MNILLRILVILTLMLFVFLQSVAHGVQGVLVLPQMHGREGSDNALLRPMGFQQFFPELVLPGELPGEVRTTSLTNN